MKCIGRWEARLTLPVPLSTEETERWERWIVIFVNNICDICQRYLCDNCDICPPRKQNSEKDGLKWIQITRKMDCANIQIFLLEKYWTFDIWQEKYTWRLVSHDALLSYPKRKENGKNQWLSGRTKTVTFVTHRVLLSGEYSARLYTRDFLNACGASQWPNLQ